MPVEPSGHVFRVERQRAPQWYAKYRVPDGRQIRRRIGPAWTERGRPPAGWFTRRGAEAWLRDVLEQARRGTLPGLVRTGVTFEEAAAEWLRYIEFDRERKRSTVAGYRALVSSQLLPAFGDEPIQSGERRGEAAARRSGDIEVFSPEEVRALVRVAASEQEAAIYLTAAFTGLRRGELLALRWRDVDFDGQVVRVRASYAEGALTTPKSGKVRSVQWRRTLRRRLASLSQRRSWTADDDLVFVGPAGTYLDGRALRRRYLTAVKRAGLRPLRFHGLRHTFGTRMIAKADIRRVQEWMVTRMS